MATKHRFLGSWAKVDRATEHLQALQAEFRRVLEANPYPVDITIDLDREARSYLVRIARIPDLLPAGLVLGDVVQNLRAALDHCVWQLVDEGAIAKPTKWTQFPVCTKPNCWETAVGKDLLGVQDAELAIIKRSQPQERGGDPEQFPLAILQRLSNHDKHRVVTPQVLLPLGLAFVPTVIDGGDIEHWQPLIQPGEPLDVGAPLIRVVVTEIRPETQLKMPGNMQISPGLEDGRPALDTLRDIRATVVGILGELEAERRRS